jgi:hypothetical protein
VWQSTDTLGATVDADEDVLWARSADGGASWDTPAAIDANATSDVGQDFWPQLITDGAGRWIAMWYSYDSFGGTIDVDADVIISRGTTSAPALPAFGAPGLVGLVLALLGTGAGLSQRRATRAPRPRAHP